MIKRELRQSSEIVGKFGPSLRFRHRDLIRQAGRSSFPNVRSIEDNGNADRSAPMKRYLQQLQIRSCGLLSFQEKKHYAAATRAIGPLVFVVLRGIALHHRALGGEPPRALSDFGLQTSAAYCACASSVL